MIDAQDVAGLLGGRAALGRPIKNFNDLEKAIEEGLPSTAMRALVESSATTAREISESVRIPERTLMRMQKRERLTLDQSDKIYRLAYIVAFAQKAFGNEEKAHRWLRHDNRALGSRTPLAVLRTEPGFRQVERELGRIEYGDFS